MTSTSRTPPPYSRRRNPDRPPKPGGQSLRSPVLTRVACIRTESAASWETVSSRTGRRGRVGGPALRREDLLDQADLAVGGGLERAQVPRLEAELGKLARGRADDQGVGVVVAGAPVRGTTRAYCSSWSSSSSSISAILSSSRRESRRSSWRRNDSGLGSPSAESATSGTVGCQVDQRRRLEAAVDGVEDLDDPGQRLVVVALEQQGVAQPLDVGVGELAVAGRRPLRRDDPLLLQEPDLGDRDRREVLVQQLEDLADVHPGAVGGRGRRETWTRWPCLCQ